MDRRASHFSSRIDLSAQPKCRLGRLTIDPNAHEVRFGSSHEHLQPQTLKVLIALAGRAGRVVTREELIDRCWDGRYVSDDVINRAVLLLRGLAKRSGAFSIETVPKAGYRLRETRGPLAVARHWQIALVVLIAVIGIGVVAYAPRTPDRGETGTLRVALLPFSNDGQRASVALSEAIGNAIAHMLSDSSLPVERSRTADSARERADLLLTGDVRRDSSSVVVTLRLEDTEGGVVLFSKAFRASQAQADRLPDQVGAYAAANLAWDGPQMILEQRQTAGPRLTTVLLKHLFLTVEDGDLLRAYEMAAQDAPKAPNSTMAQFALAHHAGLVLTELPREQRAAAVRRARAAMMRAQALSPAYGDVYTPRCRLYPSTWYAFCEDALRNALRIDPDAPYVSAYLRRQLSDVGRNREALQYARMSLANDPYKPGKLGGLIGRLEALGHRSEAERVFNSAIRWWPDNDIFYRERIDGMAQRGDLNAVARFAQEMPVERVPVDPKLAALLAEAVGSARSDKVRALCSTRTERGPMRMLCLVALAQVGEIDGAFDLASGIFPPRIADSRVEEERIWLDDPSGPPTAYLASPALAPMRRDRRFVAVAERVGLLRYWRIGRLPDFCRGNPEPICGELAARA